MEIKKKWLRPLDFSVTCIDEVLLTSSCQDRHRSCDVVWGSYLCRCVCLINGLAIKPESDLPHRQSLKTQRDRRKDQFSTSHTHTRGRSALPRCWLAKAEESILRLFWRVPDDPRKRCLPPRSNHTILTLTSPLYPQALGEKKLLGDYGLLGKIMTGLCDNTR